MAKFPLASVINCGLHICRLFVTIKQAHKTAVMSPALILPSVTSFEPNQKPWTNIDELRCGIGRALHRVEFL